VSGMTEVQRSLCERISATRLIARLQELAQIGRTAQGGITRLAFSEEDRQARSLVRGWMESAGLQVQVSPIGNITGRLPGGDAGAPAVMSGSHIDTVVEAGAFDGVLGAIAAIEVAHVLHEAGVPLRHPLDVLIPVMEESTRFSVTHTFGSRIMAGEAIADGILCARDAGGTVLADALCAMRALESGQGSAESGAAAVETTQRWIADSRYPAESIKAFVELHVEQGPVLWASQRPIGIVTAIATPTRVRVTFLGRQSHSGATPMPLRKDALAAAAEAILAAERIAGSTGDVVGTVGVIAVEPNTINTVPGKCTMAVDIRGASAQSKAEVVRLLRAELEDIAQRRGITCEIETISHEDPQALSENIAAVIERSCLTLGIPPYRMVSAAAHDAIRFARVVPEVGMIFVPSRDGISHSPQEWTDDADVLRGTQVLLLTLLELAS